MAALPYMQLYVADYLADTMHLTTEEHGAYLLLIFNYWQTGKPIPKNRLARIARASSDRWSEIESALSEFFEDDGEQWIHLRIERDIESVLTSPRGKKLPEGDSISGFKGYVYFVTDPGSDLVKIGYSKNPWARLSELRRTYGVALSVVATVKTVEKSETTVHAALAEFRHEGEWFKKSDCIKSLISAVSDGKVTTVAEIRSYADSYGRPATATTNTDTDTDTDIKPPLSPLAENPAPAPEPKAKRKSRLPEPFNVTGDMRKWASERAPAVGLTNETEKFVNYWRGNGGTKADWIATWRTWFLKAQEDANRRMNPPPRNGQPPLDMHSTAWAEEPIL